uniref:hypothetical protein n=1 Tax=Sahlingia subintegra TaxID=468936 RepID=UPI001FCD011E|nr:hypothetical protein MW427_pgp173 [Sahlingia subintegra]UNJ17253.1 hypothetical protein [Sahlingia subintegra]
MFCKKASTTFREALLIAICFSYPLGRLTTNLISLLAGFFLATVLATLPSQTGDWGVVAGGILFILVKDFNSLFKKAYIGFTFYRYDIFSLKFFFDTINSIKIGIIYGLFVDAFKLGS